MKKTTTLALAASISLAAIGASPLAAKPDAGWDLVDAWREKKIDPAALPAAELQEEMRDLAPEQRKEFIEKAASERAEIQKRIKDLNGQRKNHIAAELRKQTEGEAKTFDQALIETTRKQTSTVGYTFKN